MKSTKIFEYLKQFPMRYWIITNIIVCLHLIAAFLTWLVLGAGLAKECNAVMAASFNTYGHVIPIIISMIGIYTMGIGFPLLVLYLYRDDKNSIYIPLLIYIFYTGCIILTGMDAIHDIFVVIDYHSGYNVTAPMMDVTFKMAGVENLCDF